jgi:23S rRNA pseudouridine2604 synthase
VRINKCFREFASRRAADKLVEDGRVYVNGVRAESGLFVFSGDKVCLDGAPVNWEALQVDLAEGPGGGSAEEVEQKFVYYAYHKPRGVTCTVDERVEGNLLEALGNRVRGRVFSVGRLDRDSSGLLLLTSDGRVPNSVLRSARGHEKEYLVRTESRVSDADVKRLAEGVVITTVAQRDGNRAPPLTAATLPCRVTRGSGPNSLRMTLTEGRNRQIRKMLGALGYTVLDLCRTRFLDIKLGKMAADEVRALTETEMECLRAAILESEA